MDKYLAGIDDLVEGRRSWVSRLHGLSDEDVVKSISSLLTHNAIAFNKGLIPCERLVEVAVPPFLKLARKASQESDSQMPDAFKFKRLRDHLFIGLGMSLNVMLEVLPGSSKGSQGTAPPLLCLRKRADFIKALVKHKFPEVGSSH